MQTYRKLAALLALILLIATLLGCAAPADATVPVDATVPADAPVTAAPTALASPAKASTPILPSTPDATPASSPALPLERDSYNFTLAFDPETRVLTGQMTLDYLCRASEPIYAIVLNLYQNRITPGMVSVTSVAINGEPSYFEASGATLMAPLPKEIGYGESAQLYAEFTVNVPDTPRICGTHEYMYSLGNVLPTAAAYENGAWRTDAYSHNGDPCLFNSSDYRVLISVPESYRAAATGNRIDELVENGVRSTLFSASQVREFYFAVMGEKTAEFTVTASDAVKVTAYCRSRARSEFSARTAANALEFFSEKITPYPYKSLVLTQADFSGSMEFAQAIMLGANTSDPGGGADNAFTIAHEVAHQWFYGVVGTDSVMEPWVDEALCQALAALYIKQDYPNGYQSAYRYASSGDTGGLRLDLSIYDYPEETGEYWGIYPQGLRMYMELIEELGEETFFAALKNMYYSFSGGRMHGSDVIAAFSEAAGRDMAGWFEKRLSGAAVATGTNAA